MPSGQSDKVYVALPKRVFLFSFDQIEGMLSISRKQLLKYVYMQGRTIGRKRSEEMLAHNIAGPTNVPEWRVTEDEFIRWCKANGLRILSNGHTY